MAHTCFPNVSQFPTRETLFPGSDFVFKMQTVLTLQSKGILKKIRACELLQKFYEHEQASTHLIFASNSSKDQNLRALSNWMGPFYTPSWSNRRQPRICYVRVIKKAPLKQISPYLLSHSRIRIIVLTCPDNKSARNHQTKSCVP